MNIREAIQEIVRSTLWDLGPGGRSLRLGKIAAMLLRSLAPRSRLVEIGGGYAQTTIEFCRAAQQHGGNVVVIDPWDGDYVFDKFTQAIGGGFRDVLTIAQHSSQSKPGCGAMCADENGAALAFIDGDQTPHGVTDDITNIIALANPAVICLDDVLRAGVIAGIRWSGLVAKGFDPIETAGGIEGYWVLHECGDMAACVS